MRPSPLALRTLAAAFSLATVGSAATASALQAVPASHETQSLGTVVALGTPSGVFRLALQGQGTSAAPATMILEHVGDRVEATLLMDERVTSMTRVRTDGDRFSADVDTSLGRGTLAFRVDGDTLSGTLTVGKRVWTLAGKRSA